MAVEHCYVDEANGVDLTGRGTVGSPYKTIQFALDDVGNWFGTGTANIDSNGNQVNVINTADQVLGDPPQFVLNFTAFTAVVTLSANNTLTIRGCTSVANDGGVAGIDLENGASAFAPNNTLFVYLADLHIKNSTSYASLMYGYCGSFNIRTTNCVAGVIIWYLSAFQIGTEHDGSGKAAGTWVGCKSNAYNQIHYFNNWHDVTSNQVICDVNGSAGAVMFSSMNIDSGTSPRFYQATSGGSVCQNIFNTFVCGSATNAKGFDMANPGPVVFDYACVYHGFTGTNNAVDDPTYSSSHITGDHLFYNNGSNYLGSGLRWWDVTSDDDVAVSDPLENASGNDFRPDSNNKNQITFTFKGTNTTTYMERGAWQRAEGEEGPPLPIYELHYRRHRS